MTYKLPSKTSKKHQQTNRGDFSGTIVQSRNISLDDEGYIKLAETPVAYFTEDDDSDFDICDAILPSNGELFFNSDKVFSGDIDTSLSLTNRTSDTGVPNPGTEEDVVYFNGQEIISSGTSIYRRSASTTWTSVTVSISSSYPTAMTTWTNANRLAVGNSNFVKFVKTDWSVETDVLELPAEYQVSSLAANGSTLYIATKSKSGGEAKLFTVNGIQTTPDNSYGCGAYEISSIKTFQSTIIGLTALGQVVMFNGGGFTEVSRFPVFNTRYQFGDASNAYSYSGNRSIFVDGDSAYIGITSEITDGLVDFIPNMPSGTWCYDNTNGSLYHRYSPSLTKIQLIDGNFVSVNTSTDLFTMSSGNLDSVTTGMPMLFVTGNKTITGIEPSTPYFIIKISSTTFKIAATYEDAVAGTAIDIGGSVDSTDNYFIFKTNDYGWYYVDNQRQSVAIINNTHYDSRIFGRFITTADVGTKQTITTNVSTLTAVCPFIPNRGYFVTPRLESSYVDDTFKSLFIKHKPLGDLDKIIVKYKIKDRADYPKASPRGNTGASTDKAGIWTDTDTFTTTLDLSDAQVGDEVEIISGVGSGHLAHITSLSESSGTWTVNLDEAFPFVATNDQMYFVVDNWTYLGEITSNELNVQSKELPINEKAEWIQFKVEMRGIGVTITELLLENSENKKSK